MNNQPPLPEVGFDFVPYDRGRAIEYARRWALSRNPLFEDFTGIGGDCTNFVSQCLLAGLCVENFTPVYGWYYRSPTDRAPAFSGVEYFYDFMTGAPEFRAENGGEGPFAIPVDLRRGVVGDVVQLSDEAGDFYHTLIISAIRDGEVYVCAHSDDALDRPLSSYNNTSLRVLHINGALRRERYECFDRIINGGEE